MTKMYNLTFLAVLFLAASLTAYGDSVQLNLNFDNSNSRRCGFNRVPALETNNKRAFSNSVSNGFIVACVGRICNSSVSVPPHAPAWATP